MPLALVDPAPFNVTSVATLTLWLGPAFAVGGELAVEIVIRRTLRSWAAGMISVVSEELNCSTSGELPRCMVDSQGFFRESYLYMATFSERLGRKVVRLKVWGSSDVF